VDEGNNWVNMAYGPLALPNPTQTPGVTGYGNYGLTSNSADAINAIPKGTANYAMAPTVDFFGTQRKKNNSVDIGAVEYIGPAAAIGSVSPASLAFGNATVGTTSTAQTLTLSNTGSATLTGIGLTFTGPFARATAGGSCLASLDAGATCTINVVFRPTAAGPANGSVAIAANVPVTNSPVTLTGAGIAAAPTAILTAGLGCGVTPATCDFGNATRGAGILGQPLRTFILKNTGTLQVTNIAYVLTTPGASADYSIVPALTTCGATLNAGVSCVITVRFAPPTGSSLGTQTRTLSVSDHALPPVQTIALTGVAR
jgi:hypothetical protein